MGRRGEAIGANAQPRHRRVPAPAPAARLHTRPAVWARNGVNCQPFACPPALSSQTLLSPWLMTVGLVLSWPGRPARTAPTVVDVHSPRPAAGGARRSSVGGLANNGAGRLKTGDPDGACLRFLRRVARQACPLALACLSVLGRRRGGPASVWMVRPAPPSSGLVAAAAHRARPGGIGVRRRAARQEQV